MEQTNTDAAIVPAQRPQFLTVLCILSYIGSSIWALIALLGVFASGWIISFFTGGGAQEVMSQVDTSSMTPEQIEQMQALQNGGGGLMAMISTYIVVIFVVLLVIHILSILGVAKMWKQKKSGFWMYTIGNGILAILLLIGGSYFLGLVGVAFIVMYGLNLKHMS